MPAESRRVAVPTMPHIYFLFRLEFCDEGLSSLNISLFGTAHTERIKWHSGSNDRTRTHRRPLTDGNGRNQSGIHTDKHIVIDLSLMLVHTIVVTSDSTGTDVDVLADCCVTKITKVRCFGAGS